MSPAPAPTLGGALLVGVGGLWVVSLLSGYDVVADVQPGQASLGPSAAHWLGTDHLGRDVGWRLLTGSEAFAGPGLLAAGVAASLGLPLGVAAGWWGGPAAALLRYALAVVAALPRFVLVLLLCAIYGDAPAVLALGAGLAAAPALAEALYARIAELRAAALVETLQANGMSDARILGYHLLWVNGRRLLARHLLYTFGAFLLLETTLSYLGGFGVEEPTPSWGNMVAFSFGHPGNPLAWLAPAAATWLALLGVALCASALSDAAPAPHRRRPDRAPRIGGDGEVSQADEDTSSPRLRVRHLQIQAGARRLVEDASLEVRPGELIALVGASGSGKSLTARACLGLVALSPGVTRGSVELVADGVAHRPYQAAPAGGGRSRFAALRGGLLGYLPQDAQGALDPVWTVQQHLLEALRLRTPPPRTPEEQAPATWLRRAGLPAPDAVLPLYAHELSGGMAQRVCLALALARGARFLLADEPTTGLDPVVEATVLGELDRLRAEHRLGILLITHDLRLVPRYADAAVLMEGGRVVERVAAGALLSARSTTAQRLLAATARVSGGLLPTTSAPAAGTAALRPGPAAPVVLRLRALRVFHRQGLLRQPAALPAVDQVDLEVRAGEVLGLVGESGSGKSTLARTAAGLLRPDTGTVEVLGADPAQHRVRRLQVLMQSAEAHLNPRLSLTEMLSEAARLHGGGAGAVAAALAQVGLATQGPALPQTLSGGERRRAALAQILLADPEVLIADEPTAGLDAAAKGDALDRLRLRADGQRRAMLLISHDLPLVAYAADRVAVMLAGRVVEVVPAARLGHGPHHPYTWALLAAAGMATPRLQRSAPARGRAERGCPYQGPCPRAVPACTSIRPLPIEQGPDHRVACHVSADASAEEIRS